MCCGFKALEFWMLWLSITSAGFISSTVFDLTTLTDENGHVLKGSDEAFTTDSDIEMYFLIFSAMEAFLFLLVLMLVLHCCPSKKRIAQRGRKMYMIRLVQWLKLLVLVGTVLVVYLSDFMAFKQGNDFHVGRVLLGCEFVGAVIELLILRKALHATNKLGVFAQTLAEAMLCAMVAAQMVKVDQLVFLAAASAMALVYALCMALCIHDPIQFEHYTAIVGFTGGLALAVGLAGTHEFRTAGEIVAYGLLFAFNFAFPKIKTKYEHVTIEPAYEKSYRRAEAPVASPA